MRFYILLTLSLITAYLGLTAEKAALTFVMGACCAMCMLAAEDIATKAARGTEP